MPDRDVTAEIQAFRERLLIEQVARCDVTVPDNDLLHPKSCVDCQNYRAGVDAVLSALEHVGWHHVGGHTTHRLGRHQEGQYTEDPQWSPEDYYGWNVIYGKTLIIFLWVLGIFQAGDVATTFYAVHHGGAEGNVLMQPVVRAGLWAMIATEVAFTTCAYALGRALIRAGRSYAIYIPLLLCIAEKGAIVLHNVQVLRSL